MGLTAFNRARRRQQQEKDAAPAPPAVPAAGDAGPPKRRGRPPRDKGDFARDETGHAVVTDAWRK